ncbi:type IV pilus assembly protein PilM [Candidatus Parcubacteria bacterium]|nr:type IV pilus assembly protein PilM [Candidatus Parcubacteria bacterium]
MVWYTNFESFPQMAFNLFGSKSKLGIDIGTASIKIIELEKREGRFGLDNYGLFALSNVKGGPQGDQSILKLPDDEIAWGIKEVLKKSKISARDAVASIPSFSTFSTVIEMPYLSEQDLAKAMPFEARKYVPIPLDEVVLDWSIIGVTGQGARPTVEVFLAAVPRSETVRYQNIMKNAGLNLKALELENSALTRALIGNDLSPTVIVNIGGRSTSILIVNKGYERLSHNYEVGGFEITKTIAQSLNVNIEKAEELKKKMGLQQVDENIINDAMSSLIDMMAFETKKTIENYETEKGVQISRILLVGGMVNMPNFLRYFKEKIGREVFIGNAFARVVYPKGLENAIGELASTFAVAAGLAMREV